MWCQRGTVPKPGDVVPQVTCWGCSHHPVAPGHTSPTPPNDVHVIPEGFLEATNAPYTPLQLQVPVRLNLLYLQTDLCDTS